MHRIRFAVYDPTTGRRLTHRTSLDELDRFLRAGRRAGEMSGYGIWGWVLTDGRVRIETHSAQAIRMAYDAIRNYAINVGWTVEFALSAGAARACKSNQKVRLTIVPNSPSGRVIRTENL